MQITRAEVTPVELKLRQPVRMANLPQITAITAIFVRLETRGGESAWGCCVSHPQLTGDQPEDVLRACQECAGAAPSLHPTNLEYSLSELARLAPGSPSALCAFDIAFHDLLGFISGMPLYRLLGGYRDRIQTSATIPIASVDESVELARARARLGFRILKIKGGIDPEDDVHRVRAIRRTLPGLALRLDADGGYTVEQALDVARALKDHLEMLEQPTPPADLQGLGQVTRHSPLPILADQSAAGPASVLELASRGIASGVSVKLATCGGFRCARQVDSIARAARMATMVSCTIEPALLISAGLSLALSSPNVRYGDLDGHLDLLNDPSLVNFKLVDGWLVAGESPGLSGKAGLG
jgi:L-alanine-DL-glutamate epimerase-like enolase superfamily enzyme